MNKSYTTILTLGIIFLFFIQLAGTLVESIYILDLMNSTLDEKALGVLFFFTPILMIPFYRKSPRGLVWVLFAVLLLGRGLLPYLNTANRMLASGFGTGAAESLFFLLLAARPKGEANTQTGLRGSTGLALAIALSVLLRTITPGLDYSLTSGGGWVGWGSGFVLGWLLTQCEWVNESSRVENKNVSVTSAILGLFLILTLVWFAFSAPAVIARWTEGNYTLIVIAVSLIATGWILISISRPALLEQIGPRGLLLWNLLFTLSLTATILAHRVSFPPTPDSAPVVVAAPGWVQQIPLVMMLLLFPVIFLDMQLFLNQIRRTAPRDWIPGILLGNLLLVLFVFAQIFTNVWGYVEPVSPFFRNKFWLPYLLLAGLTTLLTWNIKGIEPASKQGNAKTFYWGWIVLLGAIFLGAAVRAFPARQAQGPEMNRSSLVVMTFNTQQSNDDFGEKSFARQLGLIEEVAPDILALQESDSTRVSLNNNDYVRYFAAKLGYYSYYGPTTVTGTYGTAILSKYPLLNTHTVFSYSDQDEIGIAVAEIEVDGRRFTIYNVHPDGSDTAKRAFAKTLLERSKDKPYVVALGDYNLRDHEEAYQLIDRVFTNAWVSVYPSEVSDDGVDMSGENRIDHIFLSPELKVRNAMYVLPPASATDHPVHGAEIYWENQ